MARRLEHKRNTDPSEGPHPTGQTTAGQTMDFKTGDDTTMALDLDTDTTVETNEVRKSPREIRW